MEKLQCGCETLGSGRTMSVSSSFIQTEMFISANMWVPQTTSVPPTEVKVKSSYDIYKKSKHKICANIYVSQTTCTNDLGTFPSALMWLEFVVLKNCPEIWYKHSCPLQIEIKLTEPFLDDKRGTGIEKQFQLRTVSKLSNLSELCASKPIN